MCCRKKSCMPAVCVGLSLAVLTVLGIVIALKETRVGKRIVRRARRMGDRIEDAVSDAFDM